MTKRIISVVVLVITISALGLILVGAFTTGEQLTIRFITAVVVAAISLYIISDLRLSSEAQANAAAMRGVAVSSVTADSAAFMNTVTGRAPTQPAAPPTPQEAPSLSGLPSKPTRPAPSTSPSPTPPPFPAPTGARRPTAKVPANPLAEPATPAPITASKPSNPKASDFEASESTLSLTAVGSAPTTEVEPFDSNPPATPARRRPQPNPPTMTLKSVASRQNNNSPSPNTSQVEKPQPSATPTASMDTTSPNDANADLQPDSPSPSPSPSPGPIASRRRFQPRTTEATRKRLEGLIKELTSTSDSFILKTYEPVTPAKDNSNSPTTTKDRSSPPVDSAGHNALATGPIGPLSPNPTSPLAQADDAHQTKIDLDRSLSTSPASEEDMQHFANGPDGRDTYDETADLSDPSKLDPIPQGELETLIALFAERSASSLDEAKPPITSFDSFLDDDDLAEDDPIIDTLDLEPLPLRPPLDESLTVAITNTAELNLPFAPEDGLQVASYANPTFAPIIDLAEARDNAITAEVEAAISAGEREVVSSLIQRGLLTTNGPISDRDVRTMVYVAFTSTELRNILLSGGKVDTDAAPANVGLEDVEFARPQTAVGSGRGTDAVTIDFNKYKSSRSSATRP